MNRPTAAEGTVEVRRIPVNKLAVVDLPQGRFIFISEPWRKVMVEFANRGRA